MNDVRRREWLVTLLGLAAILLLLAYFIREGSTTQEEPPLSAGDQGEPIRALFSPPPAREAAQLRGGVDNELVAALTSAEIRVDAALYDLDLWTVRDGLLAVHERGVPVRVVVEGENRAESVLVDLESAGIEVVYEDRPPLMHHKFFILDENQVWTGSLNWTVNGVYRNNNNLLVIHSSDMAVNFTREFEEMFVERRFGELSRPDTPYPFLAVGDAAVEVAFSPDDGAQASLLRWLGEAQHAIDVMAFTLTADPIKRALLAAAERGVVVRGVVEAERIGDLGSDIRELRDRGLDIRLDSSPDTMHHKVILIDGETVVTGSYNFTRSAEERNDENLLILDGDGLAARYQQEFERLYEAALP